MTVNINDRQSPSRLSCGLVVLSVLIVGVAGGLMFWRGLDTLERRSAVSSHVRELEKIARSGSDSESKQAIAELISHVEGDYGFGATRAVRALGRLGPLAVPAVPVIAQSLTSTEFAVSREAALALADLGPNAKDAVPELTEVVRHGHAGTDTTWFAAEALGEIGPAAVPSLPVLRSRVGSGVFQFEDSLQRAIELLERAESNEAR